METCPSGCPKDSFGEGARLSIEESVYIIKMLTNATYYAYVLKSLYDGKYYYGSCKDLEKRL